MTIFANSAFAEDIRLSCVVNGKAITTFLGKSEQKDDVVIKNQKVDVLISIKGSDLLIRVDDANGYTTDVVTTAVWEDTKIKERKIENYSNSNIYHLKNIAIVVQDLPITITKEIKVDRILGKLTVNSVVDTMGMSNLTKNYGGNCSKVNNVNKF
jgi:hypothetical protein